MTRLQSLTTELLLRGAVLFPAILDEHIPLPGSPSGHGGHEDLPWM